MGKLTNFYISFASNESAIFTPGQVISGSVTAELNAPLEMKALKIKFRGQANVRWSETHSNGKTTTTRTYTARENYFDHTVSVFGKGSGGSSEIATEIPAGQNIFPFTYQIPPNLPSSFEGAHGHVRYYVKATIDRPWKFDHNTKVAFTVLDTMDLNQDPNARSPVTNNGSKTLCCLCCKSGPIQAQVRLDRTGYVPGEFILVNASVENTSTTDMPSTRAILVQNIRFHATSKTRTRSSNLVTITGQGCGRGRSVEWNNESLQIPPLPPSFLRYCNIIDIEYKLQFVVVVPRGSINLRVDAPIILGSVPLQGLTPFSLPPPVTATAAVPSFPAATAAPAMPEPPATAAPAFQPPPPSYAAAIGNPVNIQDEDDNKYLMGQTTYTPQYAYYDWSQSAFTYTNTGFK